MTGLLPLEYGRAVRGCRDPILRSRLLSLPSAGSAVDEVDGVLLAAATAVLQEGPEEAAAYRALQVLAAHPERAGLAELATAATEGAQVSRAMVDRYLVFAGYGSGSFAAFQAVGDIYLRRVHRGITHPAIGAGCVAYFFSAGLAEPRIATTTIPCNRMWVEWQTPGAQLDEIERQAQRCADDWVVNRRRFARAAGLLLPTALR